MVFLNTSDGLYQYFLNLNETVIYISYDQGDHHSFIYVFAVVWGITTTIVHFMRNHEIPTILTTCIYHKVIFRCAGKSD